jgi:iron complex outermembrane receptor protein
MGVKVIKHFVVAIVAAWFTGVASVALAQNAGSAANTVQAQSNAEVGGAQLEEVVVTAQKRVENIQDVPIAITAISDDLLRNTEVIESTQLTQLTPSLNVQDSGSGTHFRIRGIGTALNGPGYEDPTPVYLDGVYIANNIGTTFSLVGVDHVEILKGPQGTLFGRNTTGGLINIITRDPSHVFGGEAEINYGNYGTEYTDLYVTGGITDNLAINLSAHELTQSTGYGHNIYDGSEIGKVDRDILLRSNVLWSLDEDTTVRLSTYYTDLANTLNKYRAYNGIGGGGTTPVGGFYDVNINTDPPTEDISDGVTIKVEHKFEFATLLSVSGYRGSTSSGAADVDASPVPAFTVTFPIWNRQYSEEVQLQSPDASRIKWVAGFYYLNYQGGYQGQQIEIGGATINQIWSHLETNSYAAFGQTTLPITSSTDLTLGIRYTDETHTTTASDFISPLPGVYRAITFEKPTWRAALDQKLTDGVMAYISYNRGFKSGGWAPDNFRDPPYLPETVDSYEAGLKTEFFNHRLRLDGAGYYYKYTNIQVSAVENNTQIVTNAAAASAKGFELEVAAVPIDHLQLSGGISYVDATYNQFKDAICNYYVPNATSTQISPCDVSGQRLSLVPTWTASFDASYTVDLPLGSKLRASGGYNYKDSTYETDNNNKDFAIPAHSLVSSTLDWISVSGKVTVGLWAQNLFNQHYLTYILPISGLSILSIAGPPRTFGAHVRVSF